MTLWSGEIQSSFLYYYLLAHNHCCLLLFSAPLLPFFLTPGVLIPKGQNQPKRAVPAKIDFSASETSSAAFPFPFLPLYFFFSFDYSLCHHHYYFLLPFTRLTSLPSHPCTLYPISVSSSSYTSAGAVHVRVCVHVHSKHLFHIFSSIFRSVVFPSLSFSSRSLFPLLRLHLLFVLLASPSPGSWPSVVGSSREKAE